MPKSMNKICLIKTNIAIRGNNLKNERKVIIIILNMMPQSVFPRINVYCLEQLFTQLRQSCEINSLLRKINITFVQRNNVTINNLFCMQNWLYRHGYVKSDNSISYKCFVLIKRNSKSGSYLHFLDTCTEVETDVNVNDKTKTYSMQPIETPAKIFQKMLFIAGL